MLTNTAGITQLTPAYDLLNTGLAIPNDPLALPVVGKKDKLRKTDWLKFAEYCKLPERAAQRILNRQVEVTPDALLMIERSFLPQDQKPHYVDLIKLRTQTLQSK